MNIRVTPQVLINQSLAGVQREYSRYSDLNTQATTGNRINQVSDDPVAAIQAIVAEAGNARLDAYQTNVDDAESKLNESVSTLTQAGQLLSQAKDIALQGANSQNDAATNQTLASQIDAILNHLVNLANTQSGDQYLYGGTASNKPPFVVSKQDVNGKPTQITYQGAGQRASSPVGYTQSVDTLYAGNDIFQKVQRTATTITGTTGAAPGTGTDSATGQATLLVAHTSTVYAAGSGVQPGSGSLAGDTILGPSGTHTLTVKDTSGTGTSGTISLDNGPPISFTSANTNLRVAAGNGGVVFVDTSAITPGFNGSVAITANGTLSVDGGTSSVPVNFSSNQIVTDSTTGAVTNIDSSKIQFTGSDQVNYPGTYDAFGILEALRDDLRNTKGLTPAQQLTAISSRIGEIDRVHANVLATVGEQSASLQDLDSLTQHISALQLQAKQFIGNLQSADIPSVVIGLQEQQNLLQLTLSATSRLFNLNLLGFLK